jgi:hypothetical protein
MAILMLVIFSKASNEDTEKVLIGDVRHQAWFGAKKNKKSRKRCLRNFEDSGSGFDSRVMSFVILENIGLNRKQSCFLTCSQNIASTKAC